MVVIPYSKNDLRIRASNLYDTGVNADVTRVSDGKVFDNYAGGSDPSMESKFIIIPKELELVSLRIPFPKCEAFIKNAKQGEYLIKLRYFSGPPLRLKVLKNGELAPVLEDVPAKTGNKKQAEQVVAPDS